MSPTLTDNLIYLTVATLFLHPLPTTQAQPAGPLQYRVVEERPGGTVVADLIKDLGLRRKYTPDVVALLEFRILTQSLNSGAGASSPPGGQFEIGTKTGLIATGRGGLDREGMGACKDRDVCEVVLDVAIKPAQYFQIVKVAVEIVDINDNAPTFRSERSLVSVRESAAVGSSVTLPVATDPDSPSNGIQRYELLVPADANPNALACFELSVTVRRDGSLDPRLVVKKQLDRELEDQYRLQLVAYDGGTPSRQSVIELAVAILDSNDNSPVFDQPSYSVNISENTPLGVKIVRVHAVDKDIGLNGAVLYRFAPQTLTLYGHLFAIDDVTGEVSVRGEIDHERASVHQLSVIAQDQGPDSLPVDVAVVVRVVDVNDNAPSIVINTLPSTQRRLTQSQNGGVTADVAENLPIGSFVAHVSVSDPDGGLNGQVSCRISDQSFRLVERYSSEFQVVTAERLDRETREEYGVEVSCSDSGRPSLTTSKMLPVRVVDVNDNKPTFTSSTYSASLVENSYVGTAVLQVTARDSDSGPNADFHYLLPPGVTSTFEITRSGMIVARTAVDREQFSSFSFTVSAVDHGSPSLTGSTLVVITIVDVNDDAPRFARAEYVFSVPENEPEGAVVGHVSSEDRDAPPNNLIKYTFLDGPTASAFAIDADTGAIYTREALDREVDSAYLFVVVASDGGSSSLSGTATVAVYVQDKNDHQPVFDFPRPSNDTITISNLVPLGAVIGKVSAYDQDTDDNARVTYQLKEGGEGAFTVDPDDGAITVNVRLSHVDWYVYEITVVANDQGHPVGWSRAILRICVNSSVPWGHGGAREESLGDADRDASFNLAVIVALGGGTFVVILVLLILIATIRQRNRRRKSARYKSRMEALKALTAKELKHGGDADGIIPLNGEPRCGSGRKGGSTDAGCPALMGNGFGKVVNGGSNGYLKVSNGNGARATSDTTQAGGSGTVGGESTAEQHLSLTQRRQLLPDLSAERESMHSGGEGSNADSGHGHSEEESERAARQLALTLQGAPRVPSGGLRHALRPPPPPRIAQFNGIYQFHPEPMELGLVYGENSTLRDCYVERDMPLIEDGRGNFREVRGYDTREGMVPLSGGSQGSLLQSFASGRSRETEAAKGTGMHKFFVPPQQQQSRSEFGTSPSRTGQGLEYEGSRSGDFVAGSLEKSLEGSCDGGVVWKLKSAGEGLIV